MSAAAPRPEPDRHELEAMTLIEHLRELRSRLIKCVAAVAIGATVMWFFYDPAFRWLAEQLQRTCSADQQCEIIQTSPLQGFSTRMTFSGYGGIALAMPVILWQVWRFIMPGLYPKEKRLAWPFTISALLLFVLGATVSLWTLPKALEFLITVGGENFDAVLHTGRLRQLHREDDGCVRHRLRVPDPARVPAAGQRGDAHAARQVAPLRHRRSSWSLVAVLTPSGDPISLAGAGHADDRLLRAVDPHRQARLPATAEARAGGRVRGRRERGGQLDVPAPGHPFVLDGFQVEAMATLDAGRSVLVAAPTGLGQDRRRRARRGLGPGGGPAGLLHDAHQGACRTRSSATSCGATAPERVGLLTGDNAINGDAPVVVMTTEVLRNMIYAGSTRAGRPVAG